jgi:hypothetical protein
MLKVCEKICLKLYMHESFPALLEITTAIFLYNVYILMTLVIFTVCALRKAKKSEESKDLMNLRLSCSCGEIGRFMTPQTHKSERCVNTKTGSCIPVHDWKLRFEY